MGFRNWLRDLIAEAIHIENERTIMPVLDKLTASVHRTEGLEESILALVTGLADKVRDLNGEQSAADALAAELDAKADTLAAAIQANNPPAAPADPGTTAAPADPAPVPADPTTT